MPVSLLITMIPNPKAERTGLRVQWAYVANGVRGQGRLRVEGRR